MFSLFWQNCSHIAMLKFVEIVLACCHACHILSVGSSYRHSKMVPTPTPSGKPVLFEVLTFDHCQTGGKLFSLVFIYLKRSGSKTKVSAIWHRKVDLERSTFPNFVHSYIQYVIQN